MQLLDVNYFYYSIIIYRNLIHKALEYVRRSMEIFHANLSAWDIPYSESGIANIKCKENILLQFLEGRF